MQHIKSSQLNFQNLFRIISAKASQALLVFISIYQRTLSPYLGSNCRYSPTCSHYMKGAVLFHGPLRGLLIGVKRISRCHPFGGSGFDPVHTSAHTNGDSVING